MSNIIKQLLCFCVNLEELTLQLVDSLDDMVWNNIICSNNLHNLISLTLEECHCISGEVLHELLLQENELQHLNVLSCRFVTTSHRDIFRKINRPTNNYDLNIRFVFDCFKLKFFSRIITTFSVANATQQSQMSVSHKAKLITQLEILHPSFRDI